MAGGNANHLRRFRALRGGTAIHNPSSDPAVPGGAYGTLGFIATGDGTDRWAVSCYHVLARKGADFPAGASEPIFHPYRLFDGTPIAVMTDEKLDRVLDCAAARILHPEACTSELLGLGALAAPSEPSVGMRVLKSGAETGVTEGRVIRVAGDEFEIAAVGMPDEFDLSEGGDSGSLWVDAETLSPVGLHFRGNERGTAERAFARKINVVLAVLGLKMPG